MVEEGPQRYHMNMNWLNYHHLMCFWWVAREGSVQGASQALHVTPASVSVQVKQLERSLGVSLLQRRGRGIELTEMGQQVAAYADTIFTTGRELQEVVKGRPAGRPVALRVGIRDVMPKLLAYSLLKPALELEQPIHLVCTEGNMPDLVAALTVHKLDLVLSDAALDPQNRARVYSVCLGRSNVVVVGVESLVERFRVDFPQSLNEAPFLLPTRDTQLRRQMDLWFEELGVYPTIKGEFADSAMMKIAGRNGLGLLPVPALMASEVELMYQLLPVGLIEGVEEKFYGVYAERKIKHPAVLAIRNHFQRETLG